jgi:hypothetical protein
MGGSHRGVVATRAVFNTDVTDSRLCQYADLANPGCRALSRSGDSYALVLRQIEVLMSQGKAAPVTC